MSWSYNDTNEGGYSKRIYTYYSGTEMFDFPGLPRDIPNDRYIYLRIPRGQVKLNNVTFQNNSSYYAYTWEISEAYLTSETFSQATYTITTNSTFPVIVQIKKMYCYNCYTDLSLLGGYLDDNNQEQKTEVFCDITKDIQLGVNFSCTRLYIEKGVRLLLSNSISLYASWIQVDGILDGNSFMLTVSTTSAEHVQSSTEINITNIDTGTKGAISNATIHCQKNSIISNLTLENVIYEFVDRCTREIRNCIFTTPTVFTGSDLTLSNIDFKQGFRSDNKLSVMIKSSDPTAANNTFTISGPVCDSNGNSLGV